MSDGYSEIQSAQCPIKLQKVENVKFSGEVRDFATFKYKFETIVVPNRPLYDIGLRLQEAVPTKHKHLVERFKLEQWQDMMSELEKNFGGSRQIVTSVLNEIDRMKIPSRDQQFVENIEKIRKIKRDLEAVNMSSVLEQESIIIKLENLLTDKIKDMWLVKAGEKGLLKQDTSSATRFNGFMDFLNDCKDMADWTITSNEALPTNARTKYSFVSSTLSTSSQENSKPGLSNKDSRFPCLACSADGCTDEQVVWSRCLAKFWSQK